MHVYKMRHIQELTKNDPESRVQFSAVLNRNILSADNILFSDEPTFVINDEVKKWPNFF